MSQRIGAIALYIAVCLFTSVVEAQTPNAPSMLVLRNGRVLRGAVSRDGEQFIVTRGKSTSIRLPATLVDFSCRDLQEAYRIKRDQLRDAPAKRRLELANWCLQNGLTSAASEEVLAAMVKDPKHPQIGDYARRIRQQQKLDQRAGARPPAAKTSVAAATHKQLRQVVKDLPAGAVQKFGHVIQPLLVNRCGANGCHGSRTTTNFRLLQPVASQIFPHRYTQRNLHATVERIPKGGADKSVLLTKALAAHGGQKKAAFGAKDVYQLEQLIGWVRKVAGGTPVRQASARTPVQAPTRTNAFRRPSNNNQKPASFPPAGAGATSRTLLGKPTAAPIPKPAKSAPKGDPFDPSEFNRKSP